MYLHNISSAPGSRKSAKRVGRGIGSTFGKTCGRGHKGQKSRSGGFHKVGFEGGQMPLQRRLPKIGFVSRKKLLSAEIRLHELGKVEADVITLSVLKELGIIASVAVKVKIINTGKLDKAVTVQGLQASKGALAVIEAAGGRVEA